EKTIARAYEQYLVPVRGQADILVSGIPYVSPYNVHAFLNPLLVSVMAQGYLFNLTRGVPMVKKGGTMIIFHPCTDRFDKEQHGSYIEFFHNLLPETRDAMELHKRYEAKYAANPAHVQAYRTGHAYHPAHPFYMWYWGEPGRQHMGRVIVVGADNEYVPKILGYETAKTFAEALEMAKSTAPSSPEIMMMHTAPMLMADMTA
ncbi:MAG: transcriptional regulator, partial [Proteobacteria bacterium]